MAALKLKNFSMEEATNMREHRTSYYNKLVMRRGQTFEITLQFNRPIQKGDKVEFLVATGPKPQEADYTQALFQLSNSMSDTYWTAKTGSGSTDNVNVIITSPADAPIGRYKMSLFIFSKKKKSSFKMQDFILIFNPWTKDDAVFMEDENERLEYVLNDSGIIFYGVKNSIKSMGWDFGQFEEGILDISLHILDKSLSYKEDGALDCSNRYDPCYVGRVVSAMINSFDDEGVLEGNWGSKFTGGVNPEEWSGSVDILTKWYKGGCNPVKYGQCWVFGGVMCTVLRCLGIPTRVVTNFDSAHDKDANLSVDNIYTRTGRSMSKDTLWNYHVWNESWFSRSDLGENYGGWQVLDATPQELSGDIHCCGPASVNAIKEGEIDLNYDGPFIYSEVNADRNTWIYYDKDVKEKVYTDTEQVGKYISTKAIGSDERIDITDNYKYPEGSAEERKVYLKAREKLIKMGVINKDEPKKRGIEKKRRKKRTDDPAHSEDENEELDIKGKFELTSSTAFGDDISLTLTLTNTGKQTQDVKVKLSSSSLEYFGRPLSELFSDQTSLKLAPRKEQQIPVNLHASQYEDEMISHNLVEVVALCIIKGGKKMLVRKVLFIERPPLEFQVLSTAFVNNPVEVEISYTNPLSVILNDGILSFAGSGLVKKKIKKKSPTMKPRETRRMVVEITPFRMGNRKLVVDFTSKHFSAIKGFHSIDVVDVDEEGEDTSLE